MAEQVAEKAPAMLVYPRGQSFVVSDDYPTLFAYLRNEWTYVAAVVLGEPEGEGVEIVRGPLSAEEAKAAIFGAPEKVAQQATSPLGPKGSSRSGREPAPPPKASRESQ
jgi:hypothetical protein